MLAWLRSGLTVIGIGFVVARFGLFLEVVGASSAAARQAHPVHWPSNLLGIALVLTGSFMILAALRNHSAYVRSLPSTDIPAVPLPWLTTVLCGALALIGLLLAAYLALA